MEAGEVVEKGEWVEGVALMLGIADYDMASSSEIK